MTTHKLKCWSDYYAAIVAGDKKFDVRRDDRGFQKGDLILLEQFDPKKMRYVCNSRAKPYCIEKEIKYMLTCRSGRMMPCRGCWVRGMATLVRMMISRFDSTYKGRFDPRHVRKIAQRDAITKPLREVADLIEADMRRCQEAYKKEYERAHPAGRAALRSREGE